MQRRALVLGSGAREHALALALLRSAHMDEVYVAPGNDWMAASDPEQRLRTLPACSDVAAMLAWAREHRPLLTVVGPETLLADGVVDRFEALGLPILGPSQAAARIETDKAFAKVLMAQAQVPTARAEICASVAEARLKLADLPGPWVLKAAGLAAGKGVFVCYTWNQAQQAFEALEALGGKVLIEELLEGEELSAFALCHGTTFRLFPFARDHKRLYERNEGPNTGGMGAFSPVPGFDEAALSEVGRTIIAPTLAALEARGTPFKGFLYVGLMATRQGLKVLEFNARLGDPEAQVVLPRVSEDLGQAFLEAVSGSLAPKRFELHPLAAVCVVLAGQGYPYTKRCQPLLGLEAAQAKATLLGASLSRTPEGSWQSGGGRVLSALGVAPTLQLARAQAYEALSHLSLEGAHYRGDIGDCEPLSYAGVGVHVEASAEAVTRAMVRSQQTGWGGFAGFFEASLLQSIPEPVLLASCDGVGTKAILAAELDQLEGLGEDLVAHNINDVLVHGGRPLFMLDYVGVARMHPEQGARLIASVAQACERHQVKLLGGECAEMPEVYQMERFELTGTLVGLASRSELLGAHRVKAGDRVLALPSSGLHTNGYTLARRALAPLGWDCQPFGTAERLGEALLRPHRCYLREIETLRTAKLDLHALVHVTGGGLVDNPPRVLPSDLAMRLQLSTWQLPPLFELLAQVTRLEPQEFRRVFNLGLGMLIVLDEASEAAARTLLPELVSLGDICVRRDAAVEFV